MPKTDANLLLALSSQVEQLASAVAVNVVSVRWREREVASGFIWKPGIVITASSALVASEYISVSTGDSVLPALLAGRDAATGIAVLRLSDTLRESKHLTVSSRVGVGQVVLAVGRSQEGIVQNVGMISSSGGPWRSKRGGRIDRLIRLDVQLDGIVEGGLVVDAEGHLVGMAVFGPSNRPIALPMTTIEQVATLLVAHGRIRRSYLGPHLGLGLHSIRLDKSLFDKHSVSSDQATVVVSVDPSGPAGKAGVLLGDIILAIDRDRRRPPVHRAVTLVDLRVLRAGQITTKRIAIGATAT